MEQGWQCIALDDEQPALRLIADYIARTPGLLLAASFRSPLQVVAYLRNNTVDILFSDINMPEINGLNMVRLLKDPPLIIFTTAHNEFAADAFEADAVDYLSKPFSYERFLKAVNKATEYLRLRQMDLSAMAVQQDEKDYITIRADGKMVRIRLDEICLIEAMHEYIRIVLEKEKYITFERLKNMEELLPAGRFIRVHRSYIVAIDKVRSLNGNLLRVAGHDVPVSRDMKERVVAMLFK